MLNEAEKFFLQDKEMRTLPITEGKLDHSEIDACRARVERAFQRVPDKEKARTYSACEYSITSPPHCTSSLTLTVHTSLS